MTMATKQVVRSLQDLAKLSFNKSTIQLIEIQGRLSPINGATALKAATEVANEWISSHFGIDAPTEGGDPYHKFTIGDTEAVFVRLDEPLSYGCRLTHLDSADQKWKLSLVFSAAKGKGCSFRASMAGADADGFPLAPHVVPSIVSEIATGVGLIGLGPQPFPARAIIFDTPQQWARLQSLLTSLRRQAPVLVVSAAGNGEDIETMFGNGAEVDALARRLCGVCTLCLVPESSIGVTAWLGDDLGVPPRGMRLYMPGFGQSSSPDYHLLHTGVSMAFVGRQTVERSVADACFVAAASSCKREPFCGDFDAVEEIAARRWMFSVKPQTASTDSGAELAATTNELAIVESAPGGALSEGVDRAEVQDSETLDIYGLHNLNK